MTAPTVDLRAPVLAALALAAMAEELVRMARSCDAPEDFWGALMTGLTAAAAAHVGERQADAILLDCAGMLDRAGSQRLGIEP